VEKAEVEISRGSTIEPLIVNTFLLSIKRLFFTRLTPAAISTPAFSPARQQQQQRFCPINKVVNNTSYFRKMPFKN